MIYKQYLKPFIVTAVLCFIVFPIATHIALGNSDLVALHTSDPLSGQIAQYLGESAAGTLPKLNKDYTYKAHYFNDKQWVVVAVSPRKNAFNANIIVMKKQQGFYTLVTGPGSSFTADQVQYLPKNVSDYVLAKAGRS